MGKRFEAFVMGRSWCLKGRSWCLKRATVVCAPLLSAQGTHEADAGADHEWCLSNCLAGCNLV